MMEEVDTSRRKALYLALFGAAGLALLEQPGATAARRGKSKGNFPERGWAHRDGRVKLGATGALRSSDDLLDHMLIQESFARYGMAYDEARLDVLAELFTTDAVVEMGRGSGEAFATLRGRDDVIANFKKALDSQHDQRRHFITNIVIDSLSRREATAIAYELVTIASNGLRLGATVICTATLRRTSGSEPWQFARMFIGMDSYI